MLSLNKYTRSTDGEFVMDNENEKKKFTYLTVSRIIVNNTNFPRSGTTNDVGGIISANSKKNTVSESKIEILNDTCNQEMVCINQLKWQRLTTSTATVTTNTDIVHNLFIHIQWANGKLQAHFHPSNYIHVLHVFS